MVDGWMPQGGASAGASQNNYQAPPHQLNAPPSYRTYEVRESLLELLPSSGFVSRWQVGLSFQGLSRYLGPCGAPRSILLREVGVVFEVRSHCGERRGAEGAAPCIVLVLGSATRNSRKPLLEAFLPSPSNSRVWSSDAGAIRASLAAASPAGSPAGPGSGAPAILPHAWPGPCCRSCAAILPHARPGREQLGQEGVPPIHRV